MNHVNMRLFLAKIPYTEGVPSQLVSSLMWSGQYGVQMFFAVSGFLITSTSIRRWGALARVSLREFYSLRFARIAPLLLLVLVILCALHAAGVKDFVVSNRTGGLGQALIAALTFRVNVLEAHQGYLPGNWDVLWSLSVEEMFYVLFPLVCRLAARGNRLVMLLMIFVILGPFARTMLAHGNDVWREYSYLGGMDAIALGCLTAIAAARLNLGLRLLRWLGGVGAAAILWILCFSNETEALGLSRTGLDMTILAAGTCMVIAMAEKTRWKGPAVTLPLIRLGRRSYEVYLTHMFVVFALFRLFERFAFSRAAVAGLFAGVVLLAGVSGEIVARCYSDPMNRLLRRCLRDEPQRVGSVTA